MNDYITEAELESLTPHNNIIDWCYIENSKISFQKYKNFVVIWGEDDSTRIGIKPHYENMGAINISQIPIVLQENKIDPNIVYMLRGIYKKFANES